MSGFNIENDIKKLEQYIEETTFVGVGQVIRHMCMNFAEQLEDITACSQKNLGYAYFLLIGKNFNGKKIAFSKVDYKEAHKVYKGPYQNFYEGIYKKSNCIIDYLFEDSNWRPGGAVLAFWIALQRVLMGDSDIIFNKDFLDRIGYNKCTDPKFKEKFLEELNKLPEYCKRISEANNEVEKKNILEAVYNEIKTQMGVKKEPRDCLEEAFAQVKEETITDYANNFGEGLVKKVARRTSFKDSSNGTER